MRQKDKKTKRQKDKKTKRQVEGDQKQEFNIVMSGQFLTFAISYWYNIRSQPPHVSTEEYRVTHHVMETMKEEMPTIVRSMVNINLSICQYRYI